MKPGEVWIVGGNKGCVGKSAFAKAMGEYWIEEAGDVVIADGDVDGDVARVFNGRVQTSSFDLATRAGWADLTDWLYTLELNARLPIVVNLPDSVTEHTLGALERYRPTADALGIKTHGCFVMNALPDGLSMLFPLTRIVKNVYPVKNLYFGNANEFVTFDRKFARHFQDTTIYFPRMNPRIMNEIRDASLSYREVMNARPNQPCSTILHRLEASLWLGRALDSIAEVMFDD